jgi:uncharacterized Ntn-hydrolase superfamily protein
MTFSIVARDPQTGALGVATATAGPAVGALVIHGRAQTGAIATQAMTNPLYGLRGLALLKAGEGAAQVMRTLLDDDPEAARRQLMIVDCLGGIAHWTGGECGEFADSLESTACTVGGNLLTGPDTLQEMMGVYQQQSALPFADRLLAAMCAGAAAGGDRRGLKSAALQVWHDREYACTDIRADWNDDPLAALAEILQQTRQPSHADFFAALPKGQP